MLTAIILSVMAAAKFDVYELPLTRNGMTTTRVAANDWLGEYPAPVINVKKALTVKAYGSVRNSDTVVDCGITPGIYHPWSKTKSSAIGFFTLLPRDTFSAKEDTTVAGTPIKKGETITDVIYLAEGQCRGMHVAGKAKPKLVEFACDELADNQAMTRTTPKEDFQEQWLQLKCTDGHKAFIQDTTLQQQPDVSEGKVVSYGNVGP